MFLIAVAILGYRKETLDGTLVNVIPRENYARVPRLRKDSIVKIMGAEKNKDTTTTIDFTAVSLSNILELHLTDLGKVSFTGMRRENLSIGKLVLTNTFCDTLTDVTRCGAISAMNFNDLQNLVLPEYSKLSIRAPHPAEIGIELGSDAIVIISETSDVPIKFHYSREYPPFVITSKVATISVVDDYSTCPTLEMIAAARVFFDNLPESTSPKAPIVRVANQSAVIASSIAERDCPVTFINTVPPQKLSYASPLEENPDSQAIQVVHASCTSIEFRERLELDSDVAFELCSHNNHTSCLKQIEHIAEMQTFKIINEPITEYNYILLCSGDDSRGIQYVAIMPGDPTNTEGGTKVLIISVGVCVVLAIIAVIVAVIFIRNNIDIEECERNVNQKLDQKKDPVEAMSSIDTDELSAMNNGDLFKGDDL